eukprot:TRINITY_DN33936_c1_g1_i2.p1 TRINITY_DN33936_c1_g1~~TRINITY_DN33936_c1_g1_i2.p1  ORF type:complete len:432 (-),score=141.42 TRINITY_DN33936_c1_g1_i2:442-1737(-)
MSGGNEAPATKQVRRPSEEEEEPAEKCGRFIDLGSEAAEAGDWTAALSYFHDAANADVTSARAAECQAQVLLELERPADAAQAAERACSLQPDWADAWLTFGRAALNAGNFEGADEALQRAVKLDPSLHAEADDDLERARKLQLERDTVQMHLHTDVRLMFQQWRGGGLGGETNASEVPEPDTCSSSSCSKCFSSKPSSSFSRQDAGTGTMVWESGIVLAKLLDAAVDGRVAAGSPLLKHCPGAWTTAGGALSLKNLKVLELGSGTGVAGLAAAALGAQVMCTDVAAVLPLLEKNCSLNEAAILAAGGSVSAETCAWEAEGGLPAAAKQAELLLASDVLYNRESEAQSAAFTGVVRRVLAAKSPEALEAVRLLLVHKGRHAAIDEGLQDLFLEKAGMELHEVPYEDHHPDFRSPSIRCFIGVPLATVVQES